MFPSMVQIWLLKKSDLEKVYISGEFKQDTQAADGGVPWKQF